ncbi:uncharacterized protein LOC103704769 isoform X1 [Phoenix dactylifera]|uniref:Uncharacterized protein LOC103704769 isoform X1 n=1 Tax=Phoenix dactylifera TaxID=42345 RepID=A0A8B7BVQ4_PHODC|nr:uncharacterized protein LOC103704769 isoform X1 [Phoenix dactylifera]
MGQFVEEKALGDECQGSLDDQLSVFFGEYFYELDHCGEDDGCFDDEDMLHSLERAEFWREQECMLRDILAHSSIVRTKLHLDSTRAANMAREEADGCSSCTRWAVVDRLCAMGYDAALCISRWKPTQSMPGGFHEYIDVLVQEGNESRLLVEVDFQSDFQMAKACQNYRDLINLLPETFVGKPKHLNRIVHILCDAGKRSLKEKGIHIGPWRRRKFVQKKWSAPHKRLSLDQEDPGILVSSGEAGMPIYAFGLCCNLQS